MSTPPLPPSSSSSPTSGFFDIQITQQFIQQLDDPTFTQLYQILKQNFYNQFNQYTQTRQKLEQTQTQIRIGEENLKQLSRIQEEHQVQNEKYKAGLELVGEEIQRLKEEWRAM